VFHGPSDALVGHFDRWEKCPTSFNPADHVMWLMQKEGEENSGSAAEMKTAWRASELHCSLDSKIKQLRGMHADAGQPSAMAQRKHGFLQQLSALTSREFKMTRRNKPAMGFRWGANTFLATMFSCLFFGIGRDESCSAEALDIVTCTNLFQARYSALVSLSMIAMFGTANAGLFIFSQDRPTFLREYAAQKYDILPYFLSKFMVEVPLVLVGQLLAYAIAYPMIGFHGNFFVLIIIAWSLGLSISSLAMLLGCAVNNPESAISLSPLVLVPQIAMSGLFLPMSMIPSYLQWVPLLCPMRYGVSLAALAEFSDIEGVISECEATYSATKCRQLLPGTYLQADLLREELDGFTSVALNCAILFVCFIVFRCAAAFLLWRRGQYVY